MSLTIGNCRCQGFITAVQSLKFGDWVIFTYDFFTFGESSRTVVRELFSQVLLCLSVFQFRLISLRVLRLSLARLRSSGASLVTALLALLRCVGSILIRVVLRLVGHGQLTISVLFVTW